MNNIALYKVRVDFDVAIANPPFRDDLANELNHVVVTALKQWAKQDSTLLSPFVSTQVERLNHD